MCATQFFPPHFEQYLQETFNILGRALGHFIYFPYWSYLLIFSIALKAPPSIDDGPQGLL